MRALLTMLLPSVLLLMTACQNANFPVYGTLGTMQILTIKADQPEVNPGTTVNITPVVSDTNGNGRSLSYTYSTCADPGIATGSQPACTSPDSTGSGTFTDASLGSNNTYTGAAPGFAVTVPANPVNYANAPAYQQYNGVAYLVVYTLNAPDGTTLTAFKRIMVSSPSKTTKNANPTFASVADNGTVLAATNTFSSLIANLIPAFSVGAQNYQIENPDGSFTSETGDLFVTWFYTDGTMEYERTYDEDNNQWTPVANATRGEALAVVAHDGRGGEDYQIFVFN